MSLNQLEYKGYKTGVIYRYKNMEFKLVSFCSQKVWIKKDNKFRIREFAILKSPTSNWKVLFQLGETKWELKEGNFSS